MHLCPGNWVAIGYALCPSCPGVLVQELNVGTVAAKQQFHREVHYNSQGVMSPARQLPSSSLGCFRNVLILPMFLM